MSISEERPPISNEESARFVRKTFEEAIADAERAGELSHIEAGLARQRAAILLGRVDSDLRHHRLKPPLADKPATGAQAFRRYLLPWALAGLESAVTEGTLTEEQAATERQRLGSILDRMEQDEEGLTPP